MLSSIRMSSFTLGSQKLTMPLQLLQNATQQSDHHTQQCQLQKLSQSHQAIAHQHMSTKCQESIPGTENPMRIPSKPIRKQRFSIRIQWRSHQSPSEKRGFVKTLQKPWGRVGIFDLLLQSRPPKKKNWGPPLYYCRCNIRGNVH